VTIHRACGYVVRESIRDGSPLRVVMASEGEQADGIDLRMSGAQYDRFRSNPVLGYGHSYWGRANLPIGRVIPESIAIEGPLAVGELEFDQDDEFAREVERKMRKRYLNAVSIGFDVLQWERADQNYWSGGVATRWEQTELSVVPVPMDAKALVTSGRSLADPELLAAMRGMDDADFGKLLDRLRALGDVLTPTAVKPADDSTTTPPPPAPGVNQDKARDLLAAFNLEGEA
jgi:hypothetical protein